MRSASDPGRPGRAATARFHRRRETERQIVPLARLVNEASALALLSTGSDQLDFRVDIPVDQTVLVDRIQVQQVFLNLIKNAIEAMQDSKFKRLEVTSSTSPGGMVHASVTDSGPGLPADIAADLFSPSAPEIERDGAWLVDLSNDRRGA